MEAGRAEFLFGDMVFVPNQDDKHLFFIEYGLDSPGRLLHPVQWDYLGRPEATPAGIYNNQTKGICIGLPSSPFEVNDSAWSGLTYSYIHIVPDSDNLECLLVFTESSELLHVATADLTGQNEKKIVIQSDASKAEDASQIPPNLVLKLKRVMPCSVDTPDNPTEIVVQQEKGTIIRSPNPGEKKSGFDSTFMRKLFGAKVKLEGFLLPRLDKTPLCFGDNELKSWILWLDKNGSPYLKKPVNEPELTISVNNEEGSLYIKKGGEQACSKLAEDFYDGDVRILPAPTDLNDEFISILEIPFQTKSIQLKKGGKQICGRSSETDFSLNLLNVEDSLHYEDGTSDSN